MLVDHLYQQRILPWPKKAKKQGFCTGVTDRPTNGRTNGRIDGWTDGRTDGRTDGTSFRDAFLTDASKDQQWK